MAQTLAGPTGPAEEEDWNYKLKPSKDPFHILRSYVRYTFLRHNELTSHVITSQDGSMLSFNTGLVTPFQEQIFALFRARRAGEVGPPWVLHGFEKESGRTFLSRFGGASGKGKMQLLLPVALLSRDKVELALAVDRLDSGVYLGKTVLTLDWAYNNARLLTRPDSDWLRP